MNNFKTWLQVLRNGDYPDDIGGAIKWSIAYWICMWRGHRVVRSDGWAGPDSGGEYLECDRCGWSHTVIYY